MRLQTMKEIGAAPIGGEKSAADGQPVVTLAPVRDALRELEGWYRRKVDVDESFSDACKAVARKAHIEPAVLKAFIAARVKDQGAAKRKAASQLSLLFDEIA